MTLSQPEKELAAEVDFDEEVLEIIKQECRAEIQKLHLEQEVYLKDDESSCLGEVLPEYYLDFNQDIYGADNYAGNIMIEGLSVTVSTQENSREIFYKLKSLLALKGYITAFTNPTKLSQQTQLLEIVTVRTIRYLFRLKFNITVFKGKDTLDIVRIYQTNGWNYYISPANIINRLKYWQEMSNFEIIFASNSSLSLEFTKLPENIEGFARDVCEFCPHVQNHQKVRREIEKYKSIYLSWD